MNIVSVKMPNERGYVLLTKLGGMLAMAGIFVFLVGMLALYRPLNARLTYIRSDGMVLAKEIGETKMASKQFPNTGAGGRQLYAYRPIIRYNYIVGGVSYTSDRYDVGESARDRQWAEGVLSGYQVGQIVPVYYNPVNPGQAALLLDLPDIGVWGSILGAIMLVSGAALYEKGVY